MILIYMLGLLLEDVTECLFFRYEIFRDLVNKCVLKEFTRLYLSTIMAKYI